MVEDAEGEESRSVIMVVVDVESLVVEDVLKQKGKRAGLQKKDG